MERVREQLRDNQQEQEEEEVNEDQDYDPDNAELPQCPVCLGPITYIAETNCGHRFCAQCILMYWRTDRWPRACRCPVSRREVNISLTLPQLETNERYRDLTNQIRDYNTRMSGEWRPVRGSYTHMYLNFYHSFSLFLSSLFLAFLFSSPFLSLSPSSLSLLPSLNLPSLSPFPFLLPPFLLLYLSPIS